MTASTLTAIKSQPQVTLTGLTGDPYRTDDNGLVYVPAKETAIGLAARSGLAVINATSGHLSAAGKRGLTPSIQIHQTDVDHG